MSAPGGKALTPLPELPDGGLCSMGAFPGVAYGLTLARPEMNQAPSDETNALYRDDFFAYLNRDRKRVRKPSHAAYRLCADGLTAALPKSLQTPPMMPPNC